MDVLGGARVEFRLVTPTDFCSGLHIASSLSLPSWMDSRKVCFELNRNEGHLVAQAQLSVLLGKCMPADLILALAGGPQRATAHENVEGFFQRREDLVRSWTRTQFPEVL